MRPEVGQNTKLRLETARGAESRAEIQEVHSLPHLVRNINRGRIVLLPENGGQTGFCEGVSPTAQLPT